MTSQIGENLHETNEDWFTVPLIKTEDADCDTDSKISFGHSSTNYGDHLLLKNTKIKSEIDCDLEMGGKPYDISSSSISSIKTEPGDQFIIEHAMDEENNDFNVGNYKIKSEEIHIKEESDSFSCMDDDMGTNTLAAKHYSSYNLSRSLDHYISTYYNCNPNGLYHDFYSEYGPLEPNLELNKEDEREVKKYSHCSREYTSKTFKDGGFEVTDRSLSSRRTKGSILYFKKQYGKAPYKCICCTYSTCDKLLATKHFNETHKIHGYIYVCTFCAYATNMKDCLMLHIQHNHKCKMLKCNICHHEETLTDFFTKRHKCKVDNSENMSPNKGKTGDGELKLDSINFDDEITIEKTELDVEIKQENNEVVPKTNIANMLLDQTNLSTIKCDDKNGEVVLDGTTVCHQEATLPDFSINSHKCKIENIPLDTEKTSDIELELNSANFEPLFDDEITIEKMKLDVDGEIKQENKVVPKMNIATMSLDQTNLRIINDDDKNEEEVVLDDPNSVSNISFVSTVRLNGVKKSSKKTQKIHGNTYICIFCGYTTKEANSLMSHMRYKHKCKTLKCSTCHCETALSEFVGKPHKCKVDNSKNITSNTEKTSDRELQLDSANFEPLFDDEITIEKTELDVDSEGKRENKEVVPEMNIATMSLDQTNSSIISDDNKNEEVVLDDTNSVSDISKAVSFVSAVRLNGAKETSNKTQKIYNNKVSQNDFFKCTYDRETKTFTCTVCSFETKDRSCLRKHFEKKHGNKLYKCLICSFEVKQQRVLSNHYREKHNIQEYLTKKAFEKKKNDEESNENRMDTEQTAECNDIDANEDLAANEQGTKNKTETSDCNSQSEDKKTQLEIEITKSTVRTQNGGRKSSNKMQKIRSNTYICPFCGYIAREVNSLISHMQHEHKCQTFKCNVLRQKATLIDSFIKSQKSQIENIPSNTGKTSDGELELGGINLDPHFDDEITIEETEVDVDSEAKQEKNAVVQEMNIPTISHDQTNLSIISDDNKNEEEVVLDDTNSISDISKPVSLASAVRLNGTKKSAKKTHTRKIHGNTYICTFCGYTTKEVNGLMSHMQHEHKCKTLKCSTCHCKATLSEFLGKPHKCNVDDTKNITSDTEESSDRKLKNSANLESNVCDEITIEEEEFDIENDPKNYMHIKATKEVQSQVRSSVNDIFKCTYDKDTKTLTCTQCSFETKDRGCLRKHFKKKHGNKLHKCLICGFKVKQQRVLSNHYREKHNIREYLTKKDIEKKTSKQDDEESNEVEQDLTTEIDTEQTAEDNDAESNENLAADEEGTKNKTETSDSNNQSESEKQQHKIEITKNTVRKQPQIEKQTNESALPQSKWEEFKCMDCDFKSYELKKVVLHISEVHNKADVPNKVKTADVKLPSDLSLNIVICPYCELTIDEKTSLLEHIRTQHKSKEVLKCSQCNFKTKSEEGLKKHKTYTHELHACPECDYKAKQRVCVRRHFSRYHADKFHKCSKCDFKTYDESALSNHVYLEHDETAVIHKCNKCSYKSDNYIRFKNHHCRSYPAFCLYRCVHCEFKSRSRNCLVKHLENIHNEYIVK